MVVNETDIKEAILERRQRDGMKPLEHRELNNAVSEMIHYALMLDEVGRIVLLDAFKCGQIDMAEFKRRAHRNEPNGTVTRPHSMVRATVNPFQMLALSR